MEEILVSVVIPAYKCEKQICTAINSALAQNVPLEIIVVNDCSPDALDKVMEQYRNNSKIVYLKNETNSGVAASRNRGIAAARGEYVAFLDADDYWQGQKLEKQLELIRKKNAVICSTARELMKPDGTLTGQIIPVKTDFCYEDLLKQNFINCSSVLIRTEVAREFPMCHDDAHEDYLMWLRVLEKYKRGCAVNEPLLKYRLTYTGKSGNKLHSAVLAFRTYRYMGFGLCKTCHCFFQYSVRSFAKYSKAKLGRQKK